MTLLANEKCEACRADSPRVGPDEAKQLLQQIPEWSVVEQDGVQRLQRVYKFKDFVAALEFTNAVGRIAEEAQHHPLLITEWGRVTVQWWTHKIHGLHRNDFILAARSDQLFKPQTKAAS
jgi:4a-hydroxytetrahydrobiopterin dehydratase